MALNVSLQRASFASGLKRAGGHLCAVRQKSSAVDASVDVKSEEVVTNEYNKAKPFSSIPGPRGLPFVGSWLDYKRHPERIHKRHLYIKELRDQYGDIVKESFAGNTVLHLMSPNYTKEVYENEGKYPQVPPLLPSVKFYRKNESLSPGLGNSNGEEWHRVRRVAQKILMRPQKTLDYLYMENEVADEFVDLLPSIMDKNGEIDDFNRWLGRWGIETSFLCYLDRRMGFLEPSGKTEALNMIDNSNAVFTISTKLWFCLPFFKYVRTPAFKEFYKCEDYVTYYMQEKLNLAIREYEAQMEGKSGTDKRYLYLSYMFNNPDISWHDMQAVSLSILTDNLSTTVQALLFNLYMLATNPEVQEEAYKEAMSILPPSGELTIQGFNSLTYIKACMKETFRFFPIGLDVQRLAPTDMVIGGYQVPAGTYMCLENYVPLHDPAFIPNPEQYNPDRWLRQNMAKENPYILIPFSVGTRMCVGRRFAEQELVMMIAKILRRYRLEWHHDPIDQHYQLLQVPDRDVKVRFIPRNP